jgi:hypothetical protein
MILHGRLVGEEQHVLRVLGNRQMRHTPSREGRAAGNITDDARVQWAADPNVVEGDIAHQGDGIDALLELRADQIVKRGAGDREHRRRIHVRIVQAIQEVNRSGSGGRQANAELAGELGVTRGHERGRLLVPHRDKANLVLSFAQRLNEGVDAVADDAKDKRYLPGY